MIQAFYQALQTSVSFGKYIWIGSNLSRKLQSRQTTKHAIQPKTLHAPVHPVVVGSHEDTSPTLWRWAGLTQALDLATVIHLETSHLLLT